jgi:hypothetical protein
VVDSAASRTPRWRQRAELMLTAAELISSLGEVLRLIDELAEGRP